MYSQRVRDAALKALESGQSLSQVSRSTGISRSTMRVWRKQPAVRPSSCPLCDGGVLEQRPYAALLGYYLGDGSISRAARCSTLRISCDASFEGIIEDVHHCLEHAFPSRRVHRVVAPGVVVLQSSWVHWPCVFPQHAPGKKHERKIALTDWQRECVRAHPADLLRGLFHSDGCRVLNTTRSRSGRSMTRYEYPRWQFRNLSGDISAICGWALDLVDVPWRYSGATTVSVSTRSGVQRLDAIIGPKS